MKSKLVWETGPEMRELPRGGLVGRLLTYFSATLSFPISSTLMGIKKPMRGRASYDVLNGGNGNQLRNEKWKF